MAAVADPTVGEAVPVSAEVAAGPSPTAAGCTAAPKTAEALAAVRRRARVLVRPAPVLRAAVARLGRLLVLGWAANPWLTWDNRR